MQIVDKVEHDVGVVIGRFQIADLTKGHTRLLDAVFKQHDKVVIILGLAPILCSIRNPLDFDSRRRMILESYPEAVVIYQKDLPSDEAWSQQIDEKISDLCPTQSVVMYGGRDSFIKAYSGRFDTRELEATSYTNATEERKRLRRKVGNSTDWRGGAIYTSGYRYPTCFPTVDVAIFDEKFERLLLGRKSHETLWRFIGGFVSPGESWEAAARREVQEETGIEITDPVYIGSCPIDDWRYRQEADKITTSFFVSKLFSGRPSPADDIEELKWFDFSQYWGEAAHLNGLRFRPLMEMNIVPTHLPLMDMLWKYMMKRSDDGERA